METLEGSVVCTMSTHMLKFPFRKGGAREALEFDLDDYLHTADIHL